MLDKRGRLHRMLFLRVSSNLHFYLLCVAPKAIFCRVLAFQSQCFAALVGFGIGGLVGRISR